MKVADAFEAEKEDIAGPFAEQTIDLLKGLGIIPRLDQLTGLLPVFSLLGKRGGQKHDNKNERREDFFPSMTIHSFKCINAAPSCQRKCQKMGK